MAVAQKGNRENGASLFKRWEGKSKEKKESNGKITKRRGEVYKWNIPPTKILTNKNRNNKTPP